MDPVASIVAGQQGAVMSQIQFAVAGKILQNEKMDGKAAVQMIQAAAGTADTAVSQMAAGANGIGEALNVAG